MDKPIQVGDLAVVVRRNHCPFCFPKSIGLIVRVTDVRPAMGKNWRCLGCDHRGPHYGGVVAYADNWSGDINRLKRIPPIEELDDVKNNEEITA